VKVIEFDFIKNLKENDIFRNNEIIDPIYFHIANVVLTRLYLAFSFNSYIDKCSSHRTASDKHFFQDLLSNWADSFMHWGICDETKAIEAVNFLIEKNINPSLGLFFSVYLHGKDSLLVKEQQRKQYIDYIYCISKPRADGARIADNVLVFETWLYEQGRNNS
jgi:hypothetical protein